MRPGAEGAALDFWFEFASTYSYLSVVRIDAEAQARGVRVRWRPFLLGPIFAAQGWPTSPFVLYPAKGAYMWRDMERRAARIGAPFRAAGRDGAAPFPQNGLHAARLALVGLDAGWGHAFCRAVFAAQFAEGADIADPALLARLVAEAGGPPGALAAATSPETKARLRAQTEEAMALGVFGAPSFTTGGELFWGDDRLEDALDCARSVAG